MESIVHEDRYTTLDNAAQLNAARSNPVSFVERDSELFGIDECQLAPELFPALKERVRIHKKPGQFLLTGSVRFTSRKLIRESLTGRIVSHELLPLCIAETHEIPIADVISLLRLPRAQFRAQVKERLRLVSESKVQEYLIKGGLPGICFFRDPAVRAERFRAHIDTLLQRDLRLVLETTLPNEKLFRALQFIARNQGQPLSISDLSRFARISAPSLQRLVPAFEALFLIRRVGTLGDRKKDRFFMEDQGMANFVAPERDRESDLLRLVYSQCLAQLRYLYPSEGMMLSYETRGGARVPLVMDVAGEKTGLIPVPAEVPDASAIASGESFLKKYPKATVALLTLGKEVTSVGPRTLAIPYRAVL